MEPTTDIPKKVIASTIEDMLEMSLDVLEKMTPQEILTYLEPCLNECAPIERGKHREVKEGHRVKAVASDISNKLVDSSKKTNQREMFDKLMTQINQAKALKEMGIAKGGSV